MDIGLTPQQRIILRCARARGLSGARRWQILPTLWAIAVCSLVPLLLILHPGRYLSVLLIPSLGLWQRSRVAQRIADWALDLREI